MELVCLAAVITAVAPAGHRDRRLTFLTRGQGCVRLYARRQPRRGAAAFHEPLQGGELVFTRPREGEPGRLSSFVPQRVWPGIRQDLLRTVESLAFLETLNLFLTEGDPQPELFPLLVRLLDRLEAERRPGLARAVATLRLLALGGFAPSMVSCVACGGLVPAGSAARFSPEAGGVICRRCLGTRREQALEVTPAAHGFMARALALAEGQAGRLRTSVATEREILRLVDSFVEARTGVRPRCGSFIERIGTG